MANRLASISWSFMIYSGALVCLLSFRGELKNAILPHGPLRSPSFFSTASILPTMTEPFSSVIILSMSVPSSFLP